MPAAPCTSGSTTSAASVSAPSSNARSRATSATASGTAGSPGEGRCSHGASTRANGRRKTSTPPSAVAPSVSPWNAPSRAAKRTRSGRPFCPQYWSASFIATSTAVEPSSLKNTRPRPDGAVATSASASSAAGAWAIPARGVWPSVPAWRRRASTIRGCPCPSTAVHHEALPSRYSRPSASTRREPEAATTTSGSASRHRSMGVYGCQTLRLSRATMRSRSGRCN
jgi:hypothetical protein